MKNQLGGTELAIQLSEEGQRHFMLQAPLTAWACWQRALRADPECQEAIDGLRELEDSISLPLVARIPPKFRNPQSEERRSRWDQTLRSADLGEIEKATKAFAKLAQSDPLDADATYNHGLCLAWQGRNLEAIAELDKFVELTAASDFPAAADAWTLGELLRHADDSASVADDVSYAYIVNGPLMPDGLPGLVRPLEFGPTPSDSAPGWPTGSRLFEWLTQTPNGPEAAILLATFVVGPDATRVFSPDAELLPKAWEVLKQGRDLAKFQIERIASPLRIELADMDVWTIRTDPDLEPEIAANIRREHVERFYETRWIARSRNGLSAGDGERAAPLQASRGGVAAKARLAGLIRFREQLAERPAVVPLYAGYSFDRLRSRLGLETRNPDFARLEQLALLSERELEALDPQALDDAKLAEAFESAAALGHDERTERFAVELVRRDASSLGGIDRHALFAVLVRRAVAGHDDDLALERLDQALQADEKHGGGRQRPIFLAWRAELLCRLGEPDEAVRVYQEILAEAPPENAPELALDAAESLEDNEHLNQALAMAHQAHELARLQGDTRIERLVLEMLAELEGDTT